VKRVLLTGATGFVGANLARRLLTDGHEVHLLVRSQRTSWRIKEIEPHVRLHTVPLADGEPLVGFIGELKPEWIFHLAAHGAYSWQNDADAIVQTNVVGTVNLVEACLKTGFASFVNAGSSSEYGFKDHAPSEEEWLEPNSRYAATKASATLYCRQAAQLHKANITTLRLYSAYGPYEEPTRLMPTLIQRGLKGKLPHLVDPDIARDYVHIDDVCEAFVLAATQQCPLGSVFNVGTGVQTSLREVVEIARRTMRISAEPQWSTMPNRPWDSNVWVANAAKIKATLGWSPTLSFAQGFAKMVEWFAAHPALIEAHYRPFPPA